MTFLWPQCKKIKIPFSHKLRLGKTISGLVTVQKYDYTGHRRLGMLLGRTFLKPSEQRTDCWGSPATVCYSDPLKCVQQHLPSLHWVITKPLELSSPYSKRPLQIYQKVSNHYFCITKKNNDVTFAVLIML